MGRLDMQVRQGHSVAQTVLWCLIKQRKHINSALALQTVFRSPHTMSTSAAAPTLPSSLLQSSPWASAQELNDKALTAAKLAHQDHEKRSAMVRTCHS